MKLPALQVGFITAPKPQGWMQDAQSTATLKTCGVTKLMNTTKFGEVFLNYSIELLKLLLTGKLSGSPKNMKKRSEFFTKRSILKATFLRIACALPSPAGTGAPRPPGRRAEAAPGAVPGGCSRGPFTGLCPGPVPGMPHSSRRCSGAAAPPPAPFPRDPRGRPGIGSRCCHPAAGAAHCSGARGAGAARPGRALRLLTHIGIASFIHPS